MFQRAMTLAPAVALTLAAAGAAAFETVPNVEKMRDVCRVAAAEKFLTVQGEISFSPPAPVKQANGNFTLDGKAGHGANKPPTAFRCLFNDKAHFNSVKPL